MIQETGAGAVVWNRRYELFIRERDKTIEQSLIQMEKILDVSNRSNIPVTVAIAIAFFCPYEGIISNEKVFRVMGQLINMGATTFYIATSSGMADPTSVYTLLKKIKDK